MEQPPQDHPQDRRPAAPSSLKVPMPGHAPAEAAPALIVRTVQVLDRVSIWSGKLVAWLIVPMVLSLVYEVTARYALSRPTVWAYDVTYMLYGTFFMLGAAYTLHRKGHIRTDFFYRLWPVRWQGAVDALLYLFCFFPALGIFLWASWEFAEASWVRRERIVTSPWMPPVYPFKAVLPVATTLLLVQGISEFLKSVYAALRGRWL